MTVIACIGVDSAPVPPLVIYKGETVQTSWFGINEPDVPQLFQATASGWSNSFMARLWIEQVFDLHTKDHAPAGKYRLLLLDGLLSHINVDFLDAC